MSEAETITLQSSGLTQSSPMTSGFTNGINNNRSASSTRSPKSNSQTSPAPPPSTTAGVPKTDKPRPHICQTCTRSFARLEHLKRHERSHTKEKPFECPECSRCFARRDLLLRHQQKLHMTTTPSSRPRNGGRRESTSSVATTGRVRKNSVTTNNSTTAQAGAPAASTMRPRANTLSHIDSNTLEMLAQANANTGNNTSRGGIASIGTSSANHRGPTIPKLNTSSLGGLDYTGPSSAGPTLPVTDMNFDNFLFGTVNPAALHFNYSPQQQPIGTPTSPFGPPFPLDSHYSIEEYDDESFEWIHGLHQNLEEGGSPSAISTTSASAISEAMLDNALWGNNVGINASSLNYADYSTPNFNDTPPPPGTVSPRSLMAQNANDHNLFHTPPPVGNSSPAAANHSSFSASYSHYASERSTSSSTSLGSGTSMTSVSVESITDATRSALIATLAGSCSFGPTKYQSQHRRRYSTSTSSPPGTTSFPPINIPSTGDLQRYVAAYIRYFHPHLPFLHIPTLNFDSAIYTNTFNAANSTRGGVCGGGGSLVLSIAAIGALYEFEVKIAMEIFETAKKALQISLEERRIADMSATVNGINNCSMSNVESSYNTPVWLVQAMLLNVIFGLHCGDKLACEIAMNHCAALVSLARTAGLTRPAPMQQQHTESDIHMRELDFSASDWTALGIKTESDDEEEWKAWAAAEERKRTLYAVHLVSSLLVAAYNMAPTLVNNEIRLDLPCDEELWSADNAALWQARGGSTAAAQSSVNFSTALNELLSNSQQQFGSLSQYQNFNDNPGGMTYTSNQTPLSTFGCLVLICAIHVYIWETRQRQHTRHWASPEAELVHAQVEPALKAWSSAWMASQHNMEPHQSPYSLGPLSADSIPLLDLAYIRLFVDMGRSKEAFWKRDFNTMAEELARSNDYTPHQAGLSQTASSSSASSISGRSDSPLAEISPVSSPASSTSSPSLHTIKISTSLTRTATTSHTSCTSKREAYLRKAAIYAADSLSMSETWGILSCSDTACRELPIQSALCTFDCAQVLAEWIATVQERVGPYMGVLGSEECNLESLEGHMLLELEDRKLLIKVMKLVRDAEAKLAMEWNLNAGMAGNRSHRNLSTDGGLGTKVLRIHACLLEKVVVWPVTQLMAHALRAQADHMENRTKKGTLAMGR